MKTDIVLLAKSSRDGRQIITLPEHTRDVVAAAETMFWHSDGSHTRLGEEWLRFFKIPRDRFPTFRCTLLAAAWAHDLGKANESFVKAVTGRDDQVIRHEHLSALLLALPAVTDWLRQNTLIDGDIVLSAVLTHHLKARPRMIAQQLCDVKLFRVFTRHEDFLALIGDMGAALHLEGRPDFPREAFWGFLSEAECSQPGIVDVRIQREALKQRLQRFESKLKPDQGDGLRARLLWAVRSALIAADAAGSGLKRECKEIEQWLGDVFEKPLALSGKDVWDKVIGPRVEHVNEQKRRERKPPFSWHRFQEQCDDLPERSLLLASCGSGKTLAAWRWIAAQLDRKPRKRVLFLYPTRATAKEGFRDYVSWAPEAAAGLMHSTAEFDLTDLFANSKDPRSQNHYEVERKLYAMGFWSKQMFSATVDQFLAFMQYGYGSLCMLPALVDSVVVIDEVHSFDDGMLSALKSFLKTFDVPVLCMTATLPENRYQELTIECGLHPPRDDAPSSSGPADAERYRLKRLLGDPEVVTADIRGRILEALQKGRRVLWVVNQVKKAQQMALAMVSDFRDERTQDSLHVGGLAETVPLFCYHSRFRLRDRVKRHEEVVMAMGASAPHKAALAITTQVCEMSLDLDADLLIVEECPITSLIQRMGRVNRDREPRPLTRSGEVLVYRPVEDGEADYMPYTTDQLLGVSDFLTRLEGLLAISQRKLAEELARAPLPPAVGDRASLFIESGAYAQAGEESFRDAEDFCVQAVLEEDVPAYHTAAAKDRPGFLVSVPRRPYLFPDKRPANLPHYLGVAPGNQYHAAIGYCDGPIDEMKGAE